MQIRRCSQARGRADATDSSMLPRYSGPPTKEMGAPLELLQQVKKEGKVPVVNFAAGGVATPADAALCMQLGVDGASVGRALMQPVFDEFSLIWTWRLCRNIQR